MKSRLLVSLLLVADLCRAPFGEAKVTRAEGSVIRGKAGVQTGPGSKAGSGLWRRYGGAGWGERKI
jgi:hypothetical protein